MSFSVSYTPKYHERQRWCQTSRAAPYDDWVRRGRPRDTIFTFSEHYCDNILRYYFMPAERLASMTYYVEFGGDVTVVAQLSVDDRARTVEVERLHCKRENYWEDGSDMNPRGGLNSGSGGIGWYKANVADMGDNLSFAAFAAHFFAPGWTVLDLPLTRPRIAPDLVQLAEACPAKMGNYRCGPWGNTVGTYLVERDLAATTIQKHYRGWRARMATAFNPTTSLGRYYAMRDFKALLNRTPSCGIKRAASEGCTV